MNDVLITIYRSRVLTKTLKMFYTVCSKSLYIFHAFLKVKKVISEIVTKSHPMRNFEYQLKLNFSNLTTDPDRAGDLPQAQWYNNINSTFY